MQGAVQRRAVKLAIVCRLVAVTMAKQWLRDSHFLSPGKRLPECIIQRCCAMSPRETAAFFWRCPMLIGALMLSVAISGALIFLQDSVGSV